MAGMGKSDVVAAYGPWYTNVRFGGDEFSVAADWWSAAEERVRRIAQVVTDIEGALTGLRVLDLGCFEGAFSLELAAQGATVLGIDGRRGHVEKAAFAGRALGLEQRARYVEGDIRALDELADGEFDVVLALGVLYHLQAAEILPFLRSVRERTGHFAIVETQIALAAKRSFAADGAVYHGIEHREDPTQSGASLGEQTSFWLTRPSLLNAMRAAGFSSVVEVANPSVPAVDAFRDHTVLVGFARAPITLATAPTGPDEAPRDERPRRTAHPDQGLRSRVVERVQRRAGGGLSSIFRPRPGG